jgi:transcriptional regulator with XRE-family HTH domain
MRQEDVARVASCSPVTVSRAERGLVNQMTLATVLRIAAALEIRVDLVPRWRGGELDRLVNADHAALLERVSGACRPLAVGRSCPS